MDTALYILGLLLFAALYMGLAITLFWTLLITILVILIYLAARYKNVVENYPYNLSETLYGILLIATVWTIFVIVGPKPIPFLGPSITYTTYSPAYATSVIDAIVIFIFVLLVIFAIIVPWYEGRGGGQASGGGGGNLPVGAG